VAVDRAHTVGDRVLKLIRTDHVAGQADWSGIVARGRGLGAVRMSDPGLIGRLQELVGFPIVPGTLNVRLSGPIERNSRWRYLAAAEIGPDWEATTGQAGYFSVPVLIAGRYRGAAFQAEEPGYPPDQIKLIGEIHLRSALGLGDGAPISFSVL
jgi:CTP-dependent riboflavin kinase